MAIQTYEITKKQSLLDACIQVYGTSKLLFQFTKDNGLQIDSGVNIGDSLNYDDELGDADLKNKIEGEGFIINNPGLPLFNFPTANIIGSYSQVSEGEDLINVFGGVPIPYVSGVGNDQLFDFSVLNNDNYNKNAYLGNAFALPEYYDFPYQAEIYFDTLNPYYWKLIDFHYRFITTQLLAFKDRFFARTTYDATVLQQVDELLLYSIDQVGADLDTLKDYIGIVPDFLGSETVINGDMELTTNWDNFSSPVVNERSSEQFFEGAYSRKLVGDSSGDGFTQNMPTINGLISTETLWVYSLTGNDIDVQTGATGINTFPTVINTWTKITFNYISSAAFERARVRIKIAPDTIYVDNFSVIQTYVNYYKNEI